VEETITDRIGQRRIADVVVPLGGRQLAGDDRRAGAVPIFQDLEQIATLLILDRGEPPVVDDEDARRASLVSTRT